MRGLGAVILSVVALTCATGLYAGDASPEADNASRPVRLNRPQDFAPSEMVIVPRPAEEYLPAGSLLSGGAREPRQVDLDELHRRKLDMYTGRPQTDALPAAAGEGASPTLLRRPPRSAETDYGTLVFWTLVAAAITATILLLVHALIGLKARIASRREHSRAASGR